MRRCSGIATAARSISRTWHAIRLTTHTSTSDCRRGRSAVRGRRHCRRHCIRRAPTISTLWRIRRRADTRALRRRWKNISGMWRRTGRHSARRAAASGARPVYRKLYWTFAALIRLAMQRRWWSVGLLAALPWLSGCLYHTHKVEKAVLAGPAMDASVAQLVNGINDRYSAINSLTATVDFAASTGGARSGKETDITPFHGYILLRKPAMLRVLALLPVVRTHAFDLASDGTTFKLVIPPRSKAIVGNNTVTKRSANELENLRPDFFLDSILIRPVTPERLVYVTRDSELNR